MKAVSKKCINLLGLSLVFFLSGCLSPIKTPEMITYKLDPVLPSFAINKTAHRSTLLVMLPKAQRGYNSQRMLYSLDGQDVRNYAKHQWISAPNKMLQPLLVQALANAGYYRAVVAAPFAGFTRFRLETSVLSWLQYFDYQHNRVQIALRARLVSSKRGQVIKSKTFVVTEPVSETTPQAMVASTNYAIRRLLRQVVLFSRVT